ncbi:MAG: O-antigen ligase family protein, partial [Candidatus Glassbacteria bacterium]|nr:O-antigen ligase family protein [Candidatus Glassbacteria bacterium]
VLLAGAAAIFTESGKSVSAAALGASRERIERWKSRFANLTNFENIDVYSRVVFLETSAAMIADDPLLGKGIGQFAVYFPGYKTPKHWDRFPLMKAPIIRWSEISPFAHNDYLQVFVELGAFAFAAFLLFWVLLAWLVLKSLRRSAGDPRFFLLLGMSAGIAGTLFNALFTFPLETVTSGLFFWTMTGLVLALCGRLAPEGGLRESGRVISPGAAGRAALILAAALLLAACLWGSARLLRAQYLFFDGLKNHALDLDYSIRRISRAAGLNPYHFEFHYVQGLLDQYTGDEAGARVSFEKAARMSPYFPEPYRYLSSYYFQDGDYRRAEACLRKYEKIYPYGVTTALDHLLGLICLQDTSRDRLSEADSLLCRAGNFQALLSLAQASYARGRLSRALELMPRLADLTSPDHDLQRHLGVLDFYGSLALEAGDTATARKQFSAVLSTIDQYAPGGHPELKRRAEGIVEELDERGK